MASVIITIKIMPESLDSDLDKIRKESIEVISDFGGKVGKEDIEPIAFGLKAVKLIYIVDESKGGTDAVEEGICAIDGVKSCEVIDVRRALG